MPPKKPMFLTLKEKAHIIDELSKGVSVTFLSKKYNVAKSTICAINNKRRNILNTLANTYTIPSKRRTLKSSELPRMESALYKWFLSQRQKNLPVSGHMIKEKAKSLHSKIKENSGNFNASDGWLQRFKSRFGIRFIKITGEKLSSQPELVDPFKEMLHAKMKEFGITIEQVYNADESSLYWKLLPEKTFVSLQEKSAPGRKSEKQRLTFLACTNGNGTQKLRPLVIGKAKNPRSFRNFRCPVDYNHSKTAWMTVSIFKQWFHHSFVPQVTSFLRNRGLPVKAILLLDNSPSHPPAEELKSEDGAIFTIFLPPNVTPILQPMDQNVIRLTKLYYKKSLLASIVANDCNIAKTLKSLTLKDAVLNLAVAWDRLDANMIAKCYDKILLPAAESESDPEDNIPLTTLRERLNASSSLISETIELLLAISPQEQYSNVEVTEWINEEHCFEPESDDFEEESDIEFVQELEKGQTNHISPEVVINSFNQILEWAENSEVGFNDLVTLKNLREKAVLQSAEKKKKQKKVTDFFK